MRTIISFKQSLYHKLTIRLLQNDHTINNTTYNNSNNNYQKEITPIVYRDFS